MNAISAKLCNQYENLMAFYLETVQQYDTNKQMCNVDNSAVLWFGTINKYFGGYCHSDEGQYTPQVSWTEAFHMCREFEAHLPTFFSREEVHKFVAFIKLAPQFLRSRWNLSYWRLIQQRTSLVHDESKLSASPLANEVIFIGMLTNADGQVRVPVEP